MCGILGVLVQREGVKVRNEPLATDQLQSLIDNLFILSESRGVEAAGVSVKTGSDISTIRAAKRASQFVNESSFKKLLSKGLNQKGIFSLIGHARLATNGIPLEGNNQPVIYGGIAAVHNGIILNDDELFNDIKVLRKTDLDSELIPAFLTQKMSQGASVKTALSKLYSEAKGTMNIAALQAKDNGLVLGTNNGSLYFLDFKKKGLFVFASEKVILLDALQASGLLSKDDSVKVEQLKANHALIHNGQESVIHQLGLIKPIKSKEPSNISKFESSVFSASKVGVCFKEKLELRLAMVEELKRCTKCVLPATFPYIEFNAQGVCNYCLAHQPFTPLGMTAFEKMIEQKMSVQGKRGNHDCLVPFSGGRDSSFILHYLKSEMNLNPLAYSYDWGMLSEIGRRNQSLMCAELGVEHIIVSGDIARNRENINKNVTAWLKKPDLGTVPLFMAGDKAYFTHANNLMKEHDLGLSIMGENLLETTFFKSAFAGVKPQLNSNVISKSTQKNTYSLGLGQKTSMLWYYFKEMLKNPSYLNSSLIDTTKAYLAYYSQEHRNVNFYEYFPWEETTINETLINKYGWEKDPESHTTWRIGDGTTAFYNYIYLVLAGFTENDTFRSNQIRQGVISREEAIAHLKSENLPRWDSLEWYCKITGVSLEQALNKIVTTKPVF
ncbi:MAG: glucosamine--fructose-6-phosphate aminotransferase (isomerizing) [Glaciecola sp.]|jgi:glucosamine--fructose-6-phosphate aminotransferase (isomerizing)